MVHEMTTKMASLSDLASHHHHSHHHSHHSHHHSKLTKPRGGKMVKPILKKLHSSPKNSLDLDRGWEDQTIDLGYGSNSPYETGRSSFTISRSPWGDQGGVGGSGSGGGGGGGGSTGGSGTATPTGMLESSTASSIAIGGGGLLLTGNGGGAGARNRSRYHHARSTSATSHVSIATNGSNHRPGASFVHPFQQTPRTNTPPLAYAHSFTSFERDNNNPQRDYSPTIITENEDDDDDGLLSHSLTSSHHLNHKSNQHSTSSLRRPSLVSQRTSSLSDIKTHATSANPNLTSASTSASTSSSAQNPAPPLRINTNPSFARSVPTQSSRLAHGSLNTSYSHSDLQLNHNNNSQASPNDSPRPSINLSPSTSQAPMSPLRTSLEGAFRLRSRSEIDTGGSRVDIREARRKFEEKEREKNERYEAEQRKKMEKLEKRKNTAGSDMSSIGRPSFSRKRTPPHCTSNNTARRVRSGESARRAGVINEKVEGPGNGSGFMSNSYASTEGGAAPSFGPDVHDIRFETPRRSTTTKRKTQSYWTSFMLWLRTRLFKLGRR